VSEAADPRPGAVDAALLERLFARAPGFAAFMAGPDHVFAYTNAGFAELVAGRGVVGRTAREALPELAGQDLLDRLGEVFATGVPHAAHAHRFLIERDGRPDEIFLDFVLQPVLADGGTVEGILAQGHDVTRLVRVEAALAESAEHYRHTVEHLPHLTWFSAPDGRLLSPNPAWAARTGRRLDEALGDGWQASVHPEDVPKIVEAFETGRAARASWNADHRVRMADGGYRWVRMQATPRLDERGEIMRWYGANTDIHDEVETRLRLEESERRLRALADDAHRAVRETDARLAAIVNSSPDAIVSFAADDGRIMTWNEGAERLFGYAPAEAVGRSADLLVEPLPAVPEGEGPRGVFDLAMGGEAVMRDTVRAAKDGTVVDVSITASRMIASDGSVLGVAAVMRDIRARKRAESELKAALRAKDVLLYEVNHRVKNSLQLVTSLMLIEAGKIRDPDARAALLDARQKVATVAQLHHRLYGDGAHDAVDFGAFLADLARSLAPAADGAGGIDVEVDARLAAPLPIRLAAPLAMVANELITNALKHAYPGGSGRIGVGCSVEAGEAVIVVSDDGVGLPAGLDPRTARSTGMRILNGIVRQIGGRLEAGSSPGGGATFRVAARVAEAAA